MPLLGKFARRARKVGTMSQTTNQVEESVDLLICHATTCAMDASRRVIRNGVVAVNNGMIVQIAEGAAPSGI